MKINVHAPELWHDERFALRGPTAVPGCGDLCFRWSGSVDDAIARHSHFAMSYRVSG